VVERHEDDVDDNAQRDEELGEGVEDDEREELADADPQPAAVPHAPDLDALCPVLRYDIIARGALVVVVVQVRAQRGCLAYRTLGHLVDDVVQDEDVLNEK
jgi:hypothetical protein